MMTPPPDVGLDLDDPPVFRGSVDRMVAGILSGRFDATPQNWWAPDHSWCVYTDEDLMTTTVGGPPELIRPIQLDEDLEAFPPVLHREE